MRLITEDVVKRIIKAGKYVVDEQLRLPADCLLTPSAQAAVIDAKLELVLGNEAALPKPRVVKSDGAAEGASGTAGKERYTLPDGSSTAVKPEHMTQLHSNVLVTKDDLRIRLRGEIDVLIAELLKAQWRIHQLGCAALVADLDQVYAYIGQLSRAEVLDEPFNVDTIIGLSYAEVRKVSHHPKQYFGRGHLFNITYEEGEVALLLNALRAHARHCELTFYEAFKNEDGSATRPDLMEGYNRLSSVFYILCLRAVTEWYGDCS